MELEKEKERRLVEKEFERTINEGKTANPFLLATNHSKYYCFLLSIFRSTVKKEEIINISLPLFPDIHNIFTPFQLYESTASINFIKEDDFFARINSFHLPQNEEVNYYSLTFRK